MPDNPSNVRVLTGLEAEAARIAKLRRPLDALLISETFQVHDGDQVIFAHVRVTAQEFRTVPSDLGQRLAVMIRDCWPAKEDVPDAP